MIKLPTLKPWQRWLRDITIFVAIFFAIRAYITPNVSDGIKPNIAGTTIAGKTVSLSDYRGESSLIYIWATWCPVCKLTSGSVDSIAQDYPVITLAVSSDSDEEIMAFIKERGYSFDVINDQAGRILQSLNASAVPLFLVINPQGEIAAIESGFTTGLGLRARLWWAAR